MDAVEEIVDYKHNWVKAELSDPKYRHKVVRLKTDYKRDQKSLTKLLKREMENENDYRRFD
jgi:hypothetical protein